MVAILIICVAFGSLLSAFHVDAIDVLEQSNVADKHGDVFSAPSDRVDWGMCLQTIEDVRREMREEMDEELDAMRQLMTASDIQNRNV
jgi:hypothetical protein